MAQAGRRGRRAGEGAPWPASPAARRFMGDVGRSLEALVPEIRALGINASVTAHWSTDHRHLILRCSILRNGLPDDHQRQCASFAGGYLAGKLAHLRPRLQWAGAGQNLILPIPED